MLEVSFTKAGCDQEEFQVKAAQKSPSDKCDVCGWGWDAEMCRVGIFISVKAALLTCSLEPVFQSLPCSRAGPVPPREAPAGHEVAHVTGSRSRDLYLPVGLLNLTPQGVNGPGSLSAGPSQPTCHSLHNSYGFRTLEQKVSAWLYL